MCIYCIYLTVHMHTDITLYLWLYLYSVVNAFRIYGARTTANNTTLQAQCLLVVGQAFRVARWCDEPGVLRVPNVTHFLCSRGGQRAAKHNTTINTIYRVITQTMQMHVAAWISSCLSDTNALIYGNHLRCVYVSAKHTYAYTGEM